MSAGRAGDKVVFVPSDVEWSPRRQASESQRATFAAGDLGNPNLAPHLLSRRPRLHHPSRDSMALPTAPLSPIYVCESPPRRASFCAHRETVCTTSTAPFGRPSHLEAVPIGAAPRGQRAAQPAWSLADRKRGSRSHRHSSRLSPGVHWTESQTSRATSESTVRACTTARRITRIPLFSTSLCSSVSAGVSGVGLSSRPRPALYTLYTCCTAWWMKPDAPRLATFPRAQPYQIPSLCEARHACMPQGSLQQAAALCTAGRCVYLRRTQAWR